MAFTYSSRLIYGTLAREGRSERRPVIGWDLNQPVFRVLRNPPPRLSISPSIKDFSDIPSWQREDVSFHEFTPTDLTQLPADVLAVWTKERAAHGLA